MKSLIFSEPPQLGLTVAGTAGTIEGMDLVKRVGADHVFNHREKGYLNNAVAAIGGHGFNVVLENLANVNLGADLTVLNQQARVAVSYVTDFHFKKQIPYILESNPHPFYSFRGLKNQMRIRIECGLDPRSRA
jgi:NADPH:quinone reductase-like Zn-dependent oxidoreductase